MTGSHQRAEDGCGMAGLCLRAPRTATKGRPQAGTPVQPRLAASAEALAVEMGQKAGSGAASTRWGHRHLVHCKGLPGSAHLEAARPGQEGELRGVGTVGIKRVLGCGCTWEAHQASLRGLLLPPGEGFSCQWAWWHQQASGLCT